MSARSIVLLLSALVPACATGPKYADVKSSIPALDPGLGRIFFYRSSQLGGALQPTIFVNGSAVGEMVPMGFFYVDRFPGAYVVSAKTEAEATLELTLQARQTHYVKGSMSLGVLLYRPNFTLMDQMSALIEMEELGYSGGVPLQAGSGGGAPLPGAAEPPDSSGSKTQLKDLEGLLPDKPQKR